MFQAILCPCCGREYLTEPYEICPVCGWEYDRLQQEDEHLAGGANRMSLYEAREAFAGETEAAVLQQEDEKDNEQ